MNDRSKYHRMQIEVLDERIADLENQIRDARHLQSIHFGHLGKPKWTPPSNNAPGATALENRIRSNEREQK